jgi:MFS family permease
LEAERKATATAQEGFTKEFVVLCALGAFAIFSSTMSKSPTLSLFAKFLKANPTEIGLIAAASTVVGIFTNVTAGALSDLYGRKTLILAATLIFASAPFLYLLVTDVWQLILVRIYHGFATATLAPVLSATIADMFSSRRGEMMSVSSSSQYVGRLLAPVIGGSIISLLGFSLPAFQRIYLICGFSGALALLLAISLFLFPTVRSSTIQRRRVLENLREVPKHGGFLSVSSALAALYLSVGPVETFLPLYAQGLGLPGLEIGVLLSTQTAVTLFAGPIFGRLSDRRGRRGFIMFGLGVVALSVALLAVSTGFLALLLVMLLYGSGTTMALSAIPPMVSDLVPREVYGMSLGALETIKDVGQTLGPVVAGVAVGLTGYFGAFSLIGGIIAVNLALLNLGLRRRVK